MFLAFGFLGSEVLGLEFLGESWFMGLALLSDHILDLLCLTACGARRGQ